MGSELTVKLQDVSAALPPVKWNEEEVRTWLENQVGRYRGRAYNPEDIKDAKRDRAEINRVEKELAAAQKRVQDLYKAPVEEFSAEMKRLRGIAKEISESIDMQIKQAEEVERDKRRKELETIYRENVGDELGELLTFERILESGWLNKSTSLSAARKALLVRLETIRAEVENLRSACEDDFPEIERVYLGNLSVNEAFAEYRRRKEMRQAQTRAEAARQAAKAAQAAAPIIERPTQEQREIREEGERQADVNRCITQDGRLDMTELREQAQAAAPKFTRTLTVTYTADQGRELVKFLRNSGMKYTLE